MHLPIPERFQSERGVWLISGFLLVLSAVLMLFFRGLTDPDEGRYSEIPRAMITSGNWLELRLLNYRYCEKPPLTYWLVATSLKAFGKHDWPAGVTVLPGVVAEDFDVRIVKIQRTALVNLDPAGATVR